MPHQPLKRPRSPNALSARSLVILFLATLSVSFMLLLILFQVVFKNIHLQFNTRTPETAPTLSNQSSGFFHGEAPMFQRMGVQSASVQTPGRTGRSVAAPVADVPPTLSENTAAGEEMTVSSSPEPPLPTLPSLHSSSAASKGAPLPAVKSSPAKVSAPVKPVPASPPQALETFELE